MVFRGGVGLPVIALSEASVAVIVVAPAATPVANPVEALMVATLIMQLKGCHALQPLEFSFFCWIFPYFSTFPRMFPRMFSPHFPRMF